MAESFVVSGLISKRSEIAGEIERVLFACFTDEVFAAYEAALDLATP